MQDFRSQQVARQPDCNTAQLISSTVTISDVVQQASRLLELLSPDDVKALTATCIQLRRDFRSHVTTIHMINSQDTAMLYADKWPSLVMVVISNLYEHQWAQRGDINSRLPEDTNDLNENQFGDHAKSNLSDKGWSTIVRLQFEQTPRDTTTWRFSRQSIALIVNASHESSPDIDTPAHRSALARLATRWEATAELPQRRHDPVTGHYMPTTQ
ncbi:MAG: hypothetical protein FRX49_09295 [Trebouxia sp. A1-2]|nr:MAG: hypothetical protein FRX49_09295 [Trebouxia sp. A1-2]